MQKNKLTTYLIYAIGEIVLVVIGILIAVQINGWSAERSDRKKEQLYIDRLIKENEQDISNFNAQIAFMNRSIASVEQFSAALKDPDASDSTVVAAAYRYFKYGSISPQFSVSRSTFDDLSSTGNLRFIANEGLRDMLVKHYASAGQAKERFQINNEWSLKLDAPFQVNNNIMQYESSTAHFFPERQLRELARELRTRRMEYINNAVVHYWVNVDAISMIEKIKTQTAELIRVLVESMRDTPTYQEQTIPLDLPDPLEAGWEGEKVCEVIAENDQLRVLKCVFPPGVGHERHYHAPHTGYTIVGSKFQITDSTGTRTVNVPNGYAFGNDQLSVHEVLNVGEATGEFLIIEPK